MFTEHVWVWALLTEQPGFVQLCRWKRFFRLEFRFVGWNSQTASVAQQKVKVSLFQKYKHKDKHNCTYKPDGQSRYCIAGDAAWYKQPPFPRSAAASGTATKTFIKFGICKTNIYSIWINKLSINLITSTLILCFWYCKKTLNLDQRIYKSDH